MDVHDTELIDRRISVLPGMIVTVEPGMCLLELLTFVCQLVFII